MKYFTLNNRQRLCMGLNLVDNTWDIKEIKYSQFETFYLYFDNNKIRKLIKYFDSPVEKMMMEMDVNYDTAQDRTLVLPKTSRGKVRKLSGGVVKTFNGENNYFYIDCLIEKNILTSIIGNFNLQRTFLNDKSCGRSFKDMEKWCNKFEKDCSDEDIREVENFVKLKRQHIKFKEGDYFRVKLRKNLYTYGRILMDVYKRNKQGFNYWDAFMGRAVIIEMFHILTDDKNVKIDKLRNLKTFPSIHIMDNNFYYGDYEIIGNGYLPEKIRYPIMYGKDVNVKNNKIVFQCGDIHREIPYTPNLLIGDFINNGIRFNVYDDIEVIKKCIKKKSNIPYWNSQEWLSKRDLSSPINKENLKLVLKQMDLEYLYNLYLGD